MKGIILIELVNFIDETFGPNETEEILANLNIGSNGSYTSSGLYDDLEALIIIERIVEKFQVEVSSVLRRFGKFLLYRFAERMPEHFAEFDDVLSFLATVDNEIHVQVKKLHPDALVPTVRCVTRSNDAISLDYMSDRDLPDLAQGLLEGAIAYFEAACHLERYQLEKEGKKWTRFVVTRSPKMPRVA